MRQEIRPIGIYQPARFHTALRDDFYGFTGWPERCGHKIENVIANDWSQFGGVTRYEHDPTQGPACAIAAGAATVYRNYFVPVAGSHGQTAAHQLDALADLGGALSRA